MSAPHKTISSRPSRPYHRFPNVFGLPSIFYQYYPEDLAREYRVRKLSAPITAIVNDAIAKKENTITSGGDLWKEVVAPILMQAKPTPDEVKQWVNEMNKKESLKGEGEWAEEENQHVVSLVVGGNGKEEAEKE